MEEIISVHQIMSVSTERQIRAAHYYRPHSLCVNNLKRSYAVSVLQSQLALNCLTIDSIIVHISLYQFYLITGKYVI